MQKILITGGAGFIGTNLTKKYLEKGDEVISVDNYYSSSERNTKQFESNPNYKFINHDIRKSLLDIDFGSKIDRIYNLACPASPPRYQKDPIFTVETNFLGMQNALELAKRDGAKILQASTSEIYGEPLEHPQKESYRGNVNTMGIRSCYDEGKRVAESLCFDYHHTHGVKVKVVRIFNTYGPFMDKDDGRVVSNFINQAIAGQDITIYGDGHQTRSFQYIDDLVNGFLAMMETEDSFIGPVNLGNPNEFTIKELADKVVALVCGKYDGSSKVVYMDLPKDDPTRRQPDISLAKEMLKWEPKVMLDDGLVKTVEYFISISR